MQATMQTARSWKEQQEINKKGYVACLKVLGLPEFEASALAIWFYQLPNYERQKFVELAGAGQYLKGKGDPKRLSGYKYQGRLKIAKTAQKWRAAFLSLPFFVADFVIGEEDESKPQNFEPFGSWFFNLEKEMRDQLLTLAGGFETLKVGGNSRNFGDFSYRGRWQIARLAKIYKLALFDLPSFLIRLSVGEEEQEQEKKQEQEEKQLFSEKIKKELAELRAFNLNLKKV